MNGLFDEHKPFQQETAVSVTGIVLVRVELESVTVVQAPRNKAKHTIYKGFLVRLLETLFYNRSLSLTRRIWVL